MMLIRMQIVIQESSAVGIVEQVSNCPTELSNFAISIMLLRAQNDSISIFPLQCFVIVCLHKDFDITISYFFRFVIDCGYVKQRQYNPSNGMYSLDVVQISR